MLVKNAHKSKILGISLKKWLEIIAKVTTNYYRQKKSIAKISKKAKVSQSLVIYILKKSY